MCFSDDDDRNSVANGRREWQLNAPLYENAASIIGVRCVLCGCAGCAEEVEEGWGVWRDVCVCAGCGVPVVDCSLCVNRCCHY